MSIKINILTRTSNRPIGLDKCVKSIKNQTYSDINHIVGYDNEADLTYINKHDNIKIIKFDREDIIKNDTSPNPNNPQFWYSPHNLYCNELMNNVNDGWLMFLDDDDMLMNNWVIEDMVKLIKNNDTMFIWQMRFPNGVLVPNKTSFIKKKINLYNIGSPCVLFHSKWKDKAKWDAYKCGDFRFISELFNLIPNKTWIEKPSIQLNNYSGGGKKIDLL